MEYFDYLRDKSVVLVGPAAYLTGLNRGGEIDDYDIVVRMNNWVYVPESDKKDLGSRTDVLYHRLASVGFPKADDIKLWEDINIQWVVTKSQGTDTRSKKFKQLIDGKKFKWTNAEQTFNALKKQINRAPNMAVVAMVHLFEAPIKSLMVMGCDFYATGYCLGYKDLTPEEIEKMREKNRYGKVHDMASQIEFLNKIKKTEPRLVMDDVLEEILASKSLLKEFQQKQRFNPTPVKPRNKLKKKGTF